MTTETIEELIQEIAAKHKVILSPDDPIMMLQTINHRLLQDSVNAQQTILDQYKKELDKIAEKWSNDAKDKAERILNASLIASKEAMTRTMQEGANTMAASMRNEIDNALKNIFDPLRNSKKIATFNLFSSVITLIAACIVIFAVFTH